MGASVERDGQEASLSELQKECRRRFRSWARKAVIAIAAASSHPGETRRQPPPPPGQESDLPVLSELQRPIFTILEKPGLSSLQRCHVRVQLSQVLVRHVE